VFGCHPKAPAQRYDAQGLLWLVGAGEIVAMTLRTATIRSPNGSLLTYARVPGPPGEPPVALWDLSASDPARNRSGLFDRMKPNVSQP
jgi:hypothetical protein